MGYIDRIDSLRRMMEERGLDLVMALAGPNSLYLTGYTAIAIERLISILIFKDSPEVYLIAPKLEEERAEKFIKVPNFSVFVYEDGENPFVKFAGLCNKMRVNRIGVEGITPYSFITNIRKELPDVSFEIVDELFHSLRIVKDSAEIKLLERAADINMRVMLEAISNIEEGMSERMLMNKIRSWSIEFGGESSPFTLVQSGPNSSMPHEEPTDRKIRKGDIVLLDLGVTYGGYVSDITRTFVFGSSNEKQSEIFDVVKEAQLEALSIIRPGVPAEDVDNVARNVIVAHGYGELFTHRTGHGLGLGVHERPQIASGNKLKLRPGMAFTVEPGIYVPGEFGVRLEDNVVVTEDGVNNITKLPKSLDMEEYV